MTPEEFDQAEHYWVDKEATSKRMPKKAARGRINAFLMTHNTCALATGCDDFVRCTPIEYNWHDGYIWMFSEGGLKFRGLAHNPQVCLAVFDPYEGMGKTHGLQVMGEAELVDADGEVFARELSTKGVTPEQLHKAGASIHLIKVTPTAFDLLDSDLRKEGFDARQHINFFTET